jgi:hypothetical protein
MIGRSTSYIGLFSTPGNVTSVQIPQLQRDYAQGRQNAPSSRVRRDFLEVLHAAVAGNTPVDLDFVYGDVKDGALVPLDGQQRLTTLFLLHWYIAARAGVLDAAASWTRLTYHTRPSAREFCRRLVSHPPRIDVAPSTWIVDQPWFLSTWRHDPSIQAMLVMIDAVHERFAEVDATQAWARLSDPARPAIRFHILGLEEMGLAEETYIRLNARGKPLTDFEHFKALFEQLVESVDPERAALLSHRIDGDWSDILWSMRGDDDLIDDEFLRYFDFVLELCAWRRNVSLPQGRLDRAERIFGPTAEAPSDALTFLLSAFDCWKGVDADASFDGWFSLDQHEPGKVALFGRDTGTNLLAACCRLYGETAGRTRAFPLQRTLLLYAVLVHRIESTADFSRRLRIVRNLIEASPDEVRVEEMPVLTGAVHTIIGTGSLREVRGFNQRQLEEERRKAAFLLEYPSLEPALHALEDHPLLRGCLGAFDLDPNQFAARAAQFTAVFVDANLNSLTGTLLACGNYAQRQANRRFFQLGSDNSAPWRALLSGAGRPELDNTRAALARLLDELGGLEGPVPELLERLRAVELARKEESGERDWRYYLVKYPEMRSGASGLYTGRDGRMGYSLCMLEKRQMNSYYRDPYLLAVWRRSGVGPAVEDPWFMGYEWWERWMELKRSRAALRCIDAGFALRPPPQPDQRVVFDRVCAAHAVGEDLVLAMAREPRNGTQYDARDRIEVGASFLRDLVAAGG